MGINGFLLNNYTDVTSVRLLYVSAHDLQARCQKEKNTCKLAWLTEKGELKKPLTMAITVSVTYFSRAGSAWLRSVVVLHTCNNNNNNKHQHDYTEFITIEFRPSLLNHLFVFLYRLNAARM